MKTVGEMIDYLSKFPREYELKVTRSDDGGELAPYCEGETRQGEKRAWVVLTTKDV